LLARRLSKSISSATAETVEKAEKLGDEENPQTDIQLLDVTFVGWGGQGHHYGKRIIEMRAGCVTAYLLLRNGSGNIMPVVGKNRFQCDHSFNPNRACVSLTHFEQVS
jgi:hypothetical protein